MESKIERSIFAILSTIIIDNLTSEQATFILHSAYVKEKLKFQIKNTIIDIGMDNYHQLLDNLLEIHNSNAHLKLITADSIFEPAIKMSPKRFLFYVDKIINDEVEILMIFT